MSPLPATLSMLAQSQSSPRQTLVNNESEVTTDTSEMTSSAPTTVQNQICPGNNISPNSIENTNNNNNNNNNNNINNINMNNSENSNNIPIKSSDFNILNSATTSSTTKNSTTNNEISESSENVKSDVQNSSKIAINDSKSTEDSSTIVIDDSSTGGTDTTIDTNTNTNTNNNNNTENSKSNNNCKNKNNDSVSSSSSKIENCSQNHPDNNSNKHDKCDYSSKSSNKVIENNDNNSNCDDDEMNSYNEEEINNTEEVLDKPRRILLENVNPHIICNLCKGYLIDATTIVECLHSFCHGCIMKHLRTEQYCPRCEMMINTAKPNIKPDTTLQAIVYKLVPGLYEKELMRKRAFYRDRPEDAKLATPEQRGDDTEYLIFGPTENMSLSLEYADIEELPEGNNWNDLKRPKYLQCPAIFTVSHLKKFILLKFGINSNLFTVEIMYKVKTIVLSNHYTLMDVAYIYTWKRDAPMRFFFRIKKVDGFDEKLKACRRLIKTKEIKNENKSNKILIKEENNNKNTQNSTDSIDKNDKLIIIKKENDNTTTEIEKNKETNMEISSDNDNVMRKNSLSRKSIELVEDIKTEIEIEDKNNSVEIESIKTENDIKDELNDKSSSIAGSSTNTKNTCKTQLKTNSKDDHNENKIETSNKPEKLKMTFSMKNKQQPKINSSIDDSKIDSSTKSLHKNNKTSKQQQQQQQQQTPNTAIGGNSQKSPDQEERKVENIKLKIDLSKQNSVTIINMSGPDNTRKEIVKPVKQEKEWKLKTKKDKDNSPKLSPKGEDKYTIKSNEDQQKQQQKQQQRNTSEDSKKLLVPPITIKAERISPNSKEKSTVQLKIKHDEIKPESDNNSVNKNTNENEDDEEKSKFLNSFALTPIKSTNSPDKNNIKKPKPFEIPAIPSQLTGSVVSIPNKTVNVSKRKSKEPIKAFTKKSKLESAKTKIDEPTKMIKPIEKSPPKETQTISFKLAPFPIDSSSSSTELTKKQEDEKLMPAPPPLKVIDVLKKNGMKQVKQSRSSKWSVGNKTKVASQSSQIPAPPGSLTPRPIISTGISSSKLPITAAPPGNRTPIARRYPPILPKSPRPNPFANLPTDVNKLLQHNGTEIKQIPSGNGQELKVYGPAMQVKNNNQKSTSPTSMPPPNMSPVRGVTKNQTTNYLNYALMNASKTKVDVMPLGCRTPIYTPNSPIYSPNSPQYMPNYNIPTHPTYKYTKTQSSANNYLQNVLGQNKQLSNLFPAPPVKKPPEQNIGNRKTPPPPSPPTPMAITSNDENAAKRSYPFSKSPPNSIEKSLEPPEKQIKVQSLLNSCNINIPSSLSITITNEDNESGSVSGSNLKHKSPVNNYIEILKLPDNPAVSSNDQTPLDPKLKTNNSFELKNESGVLSTNSLTSVPTTSSTKTITTNNTPRSSPMQITGSQTTKNTSNVNLTRSSNTYEKKSDTVKTPSPNSKEKKTSPDKKTTEKNQKKNQALQDKKKSPDNNTVKQGKTSDTTNNMVSLKKFRHILPRVTTTSQSISTTTLSVSTPAKSSPVQRNSLKQQSQQKISPSAAKKHNSVNLVVDDKKPEILDLTGSSSKTPPPIMTSSLQLPPISPVTTVTASINPPQMPPGASDIAAFLNETILRAQQHSAANGNGIFLPHLAAAASFNPSFASINFGYNIQQAYLMEQFSRMQKAGHEALEKYMQKLKANTGGNGGGGVGVGVGIGGGGCVKSGPNSPNDSLNNSNITNTSANNSGSSSGTNIVSTCSSPQMKTSETK